MLSLLWKIVFDVFFFIWIAPVPLVGTTHRNGTFDELYISVRRKYKYTNGLATWTLSGFPMLSLSIIKHNIEFSIT